MNKSHLTTASGVALGILWYAHSIGIKIPTTKQEALNLLIALLFAGFGVAAKDYNVTGGTK